MINFYGVTFDHLVPADEINPEVLQIDIIEVEDDGVSGGVSSQIHGCYLL